MSNDGETQRKDKLLKVLKDAEDTAAPLENKGQEVVRIARNSRDLAKSFSKFIDAVPAGNSVISQHNWNELTTTWQSHNDSARDLTRVLTEAIPGYALRAQVTALSTSSTVTASFAVRINFPMIEPALQKAAKEMDAIFQREPLKNDVRAAFVKFGLDRPHGTGRSPLNLLMDSRFALEHPSGEESSPIGVLIALREAIDSAIAEILRRCPGQESTPHFDDKILSIGKRCSAVGIARDYFNFLGRTGKKLHETLSNAKQTNISRDQLFLSFDEGLLFLRTLLSVLDETKLHP